MDNSDRWVEKYGESFMDFPLKGLKFKKTAWTKKNNHTHCLFCGDEITDEEYNYHTEKQGYASTTKFWWSCPECFEVFTQKYNLPVVKNTVKDIESALSQFKTVVISLENKQYFIKNTDGKITVEHNGVRILTPLCSTVILPSVFLMKYCLFSREITTVLNCERADSISLTVFLTTGKLYFCVKTSKHSGHDHQNFVVDAYPCFSV